MIEEIQKKVLFEKAAKLSILRGNFIDLGEVYRDLLGVSDFGKPLYGNPVAPIYQAKSGDIIDISRIGKFFSGLATDVSVARLGIYDLENSLVNMSVGIWADTELLNGMVRNLTTLVDYQLNRSGFSSWSFLETFYTTGNIDLDNTNLWIDTSEGIAYIPVSLEDRPIMLGELEVVRFTPPEGGSFMGTSPDLAFDGKPSTAWVVSFGLGSSSTSAIVSLANKTRISFVTLDPLGGGLGVRLIEENSEKVLLDTIVYSKTTYPVDFSAEIDLIRVELYPVNGNLITGIREIRFVTKEPSNFFGNLVTKNLRPNQPFRQLLLTANYDNPGSSMVEFYYSTDGIEWNPLPERTWVSVEDIGVRTTSVYPYPPGSRYNGRLFFVPVIPTGSSIDDGSLYVGEGQVKVSAFRHVWISEGVYSNALSILDFEKEHLVRTTWGDVGEINFESGYANVIPALLQAHDEDFLAFAGITSPGTVLLFSRQVGNSDYSHLEIVPHTGNPNINLLQNNYNYWFRFKIYCQEDVNISGANLYAYQGYKKAGTRSFSGVGRRFGSLTVFVNGQLSVSSDSIGTVYDDHTWDELGVNPFSLSLRQGWNEVDIFVSVTDPSLYGDDPTLTGGPYTQFSIYPNILDRRFREDNAITYVATDVDIPPTNEFDLLWKFGRSFTSWAWSPDLNGILLNVGLSDNPPIDGYFKGLLPNVSLKYRPGSVDFYDLYIKAVLIRNSKVDPSPVLRQFSLEVR